MTCLRIYPGLLFLFLLLFPLHGQQLPPRLHWEKYEGKHFEVIFPESYREKAEKIFLYLENNKNAIYDSLPVRAKKIPVVINNYSAVSNGYATLLPRKLHFYMAPYDSPYFGGTSWYELLSIHETRHMAQFDAANHGLIRIYRWLSGGLGQSIGMMLAFPLWYFEGDAVYKESMLSRSGRAFSGDFIRPVKMVAHEYPEKYQNYYRFYYRSYNRYYPSHYHLGFFLTSYLHQHYPQKWNAIIKTANNLAFFPGGYHVALGIHTKFSYPKLTATALSEAKKMYPVSQKEESLSGFLFDEEKEAYVNELFPQLDNGKLYFSHASFDKTPELYRYDFHNSPEKITDLPDMYFHIRKSWITWSEFRPHPRFTEKTYRVIVVKNIKTGEKFILGNKGNFHSPRLSSDLTEILAVGYNNLSEPFLALFDFKTRRIKERIPFPDFDALFYPAFSPDNSQIVFSGNIPGKGNGLFIYNRKTRQPDTLIPPSFIQNISHPQFKGNYVYFTSDYAGTPDIYRIHLENKQIEKLTRTPYGTGAFAFTGKGKLIAPVYGPKGFRLARLSPAPEHVDSLAPKPVYLPQTASRPFRKKPQLIESPKPQKFNRLKSYLIPHSWAYVPLVNPVDESFVFSGMLLSNDLLDEFSYQVAGMISQSGEYTLQAGFVYKRFYPQWAFSWARFRSTDGLRDGYSLTNEIRIPLTYRSGQWYKNLNFSVFHTGIQNLSNAEQFSGIKLSGSAFKQAAYRDAESRKALLFSGTFRHGWITGSRQWNVFAEGRIPGFFKHDILKLRLFNTQRSGTFVFANTYPVVRGYDYFGYISLAALETEWHTNLFYPDMGIKRLFFLKRLRLKTIYAYSLADNKNYQSASFQLIGDWNFLGYNVEFPVGIQLSYIFPIRKWTVSAVLVNFAL